MDGIDDDYAGDLQPLLDDLAALRRVLGESYQHYVEDEVEGEGRPSQPTEQQRTARTVPVIQASITERLAAVTVALEANQALQQRLKRILAAVVRAQDVAVGIRERVRATELKRMAAASTPHAADTQRHYEQRNRGVSWFWPQPGVPPPPPYPGSTDHTLIASVLPLALGRRAFSEEEKRSLAEGVLQVVQERFLTELLNELEETQNKNNVAISLEEIEAKQAPIRDLTIDSPSVLDVSRDLTNAEWTTIASRCMPGRSGSECRLQWLNHAIPTVNNAPFSREEDEKLLELVRDHGTRAWQVVSYRLMAYFKSCPGRTPLACMSRYQQLSFHSQRSVREFTEHDMQRLIEIVDRVGVAWKRIAEEFGGPWDADQLMHFWRRSFQRREGGAIEPRTGKWSKSEDEALLAAVALYGRKWSQVATIVPGRTDVQCRERFVNCLDPSIKLNAEWTEEEDNVLIKAVEDQLQQEGSGQRSIKWSMVATLLPGRTDNNCMKRWKRLMKWKEEASGFPKKMRSGSVKRVMESDGGAKKKKDTREGPVPVIGDNAKGYGHDARETTTRSGRSIKPTSRYND